MNRMSVFITDDNPKGYVQAVISTGDFPVFARLGFVKSANEVKPLVKRGRKVADNGNDSDKG